MKSGEFYHTDVFVWVPGYSGTRVIPGLGERLTKNALRSYYYTSVVGDERKIESVRESLWNLNFSPEVFKKDRQQEKAKGVDIALTKDLLSHAFRDNYDVAVLIAGDGDYVPLIEEVKRLGKLVYVAFFTQVEGLNRELRIHSDHFCGLDKVFAKAWPDQS